MLPDPKPAGKRWWPPRWLNALNAELLSEFRDALDVIEADGYTPKYGW